MLLSPEDMVTKNALCQFEVRTRGRKPPTAGLMHAKDINYSSTRTCLSIYIISVYSAIAHLSSRLKFVLVRHINCTFTYNSASQPLFWRKKSLTLASADLATSGTFSQGHRLFLFFFYDYYYVCIYVCFSRNDWQYLVSD